MKRLSIFLALLIASFCVVQAQDKNEELPGNPKLPSTTEELAAIAAYDKGKYAYQVEDYFTRPQLSRFKLSSDGQYFSYRERNEDGTRPIYIKHIASGKVSKVVDEGEELIAGYDWANNEQLIYLQDKGGDENYQLFSVNIDGSAAKNLTPYEGVVVDILSGLPDEPDYLIISMNKNNPEVFEPFKINIKTGELELLFENKDPESPIEDYYFDRTGRLYAYAKMINGVDFKLYYQPIEEAPFQLVIKTGWEDYFDLLKPDYSTKYRHDAFVATNIDNNTVQIVRYDLKKKKVLETIFEHKEFDVIDANFSIKRNYELDYIEYEGAKSKLVPMSDVYSLLHTRFEKAFAGKQFKISDKTRNEDYYLLYVSSDKLYGEYHLYDVKADRFTKLVDLMPQLKEKDMSEMRPISFKSRDGFTVHGYLTWPKGVAQNQQVPLIMHPHGGPYGERDSWEFNPETQLFASRGYATLQVNFRGSGGYGKEFYLAGSKQIGRNMLNDLEDAAAYAIAQGWTSEGNLAIYGASYGGLATLGSLVKTPDLYACGVDYVGVSNLFTFVNSFPSYWKPYMKQFYAQWYDMENPEEKKIMGDVSPALHTDKITKPIFVVQGANDPRVNINESDQVVEKLRTRGYDVPYMVKYNEGHGFGHEGNRIELYKTMLGFFAKHLKKSL